MGRSGRQKRVFIYRDPSLIHTHRDGVKPSANTQSLHHLSYMLFVRHPRLNSHWDAERVSDLLHLVGGSPLHPVTSIPTAAHTFPWSIRNQPFCSSATRSSKLFTKLTITFWDSTLNYWHKPRCYFQSACGLKINVSSVFDLGIGLFCVY